MTHPQLVLTRRALAKAVTAIELLEHSRKTVKPYAVENVSTPQECEPYDAMSDRFIRATEVAIQCMRSLEKWQFGETSDTLRDLLHRMEALGLVGNANLWMDMRDIRNRIVHDYFPGGVKAIYDDILGPFGAELQRFKVQAMDKLQESDDRNAEGNA